MSRVSTCMYCDALVADGGTVCGLHAQGDPGRARMLWLCVVPRGELFVGDLQPLLARDRAEAERLVRQVLGWKSLPQMEGWPAQGALPMLRWLAEQLPPCRMRPLINGAWFENRQEVRHG